MRHTTVQWDRHCNIHPSPNLPCPTPSPFSNKGYSPAAPPPEDNPRLFGECLTKENYHPWGCRPTKASQDPCLIPGLPQNSLWYQLRTHSIRAQFLPQPTLSSSHVEPRSSILHADFWLRVCLPKNPSCSRKWGWCEEECFIKQTLQCLIWNT